MPAGLHFRPIVSFLTDPLKRLMVTNQLTSS
jgi:hypothetical protein